MDEEQWPVRRRLSFAVRKGVSFFGGSGASEGDRPSHSEAKDDSVVIPGYFLCLLCVRIYFLARILPLSL